MLSIFPAVTGPCDFFNFFCLLLGSESNHCEDYEKNLNENVKNIILHVVRLMLPNTLQRDPLVKITKWSWHERSHFGMFLVT